MSHLSPTAIFSPSLARLHATQSKDWNYIDAWLFSKFSPRAPPPFERTPETLKYLLSLAALNEAADEDRDLLSKAEGRALAELQTLSTDENGQEKRDLLSELEDGLTREGKTALDALAETALLLNQPLASPTEMAQRIVALQSTSFDLAQASSRVEIQHAHLQRELELVNALLSDLQSPTYSPDPTLAKQTLEHQRKSKVLAAKLPELRDRAAALSAGSAIPKPSIQDIEAEERKFRDDLKRTRELEAQVKSYHGLPHDTDLARLELETLRVELQELIKERDSQFEGLVERESPKKRRNYK